MRRSSPIFAVLLSSFVLVSACEQGQQAEEPYDEVDASFLAEGKADTGGIVEGSPEAKGALKVASEATLAQLVADPYAEEPGAGLYRKAAEAIVAYREKKGGPYESLAELDAVDYVGPVAFWKLVDYAERQGFVALSGKIYRNGDILHYDGYQYLVVGNQLMKQTEACRREECSVTVLWQRYVEADRLALDAANEKLVVFGAHKLYVVSLSGVIEKTFDEGYADVPSLGGTTMSSVCAYYTNMSAYYHGLALGACMVANYPLCFTYDYWARVFDSMVNTYCK